MRHHVVDQHRPASRPVPIRDGGTVRPLRYSSAAKRFAVAALTEKSNFICEGELHRKFCLPPGGRWHAKRDGRRRRDYGGVLASFLQALPPLYPALSLSHGKAVTAPSRREPQVWCGRTCGTWIFCTNKKAGDRWSPLRRKDSLCVVRRRRGYLFPKIGYASQTAFPPSRRAPHAKQGGAEL